MFVLQFLVHKFDTVTKGHVFKAVVALLAAMLLGLIYDLRHFKNMSTQEAMDAAQVARNLSDGRGFTTLFIRPLSLSLLKSARSAEATNTLAGGFLAQPGIPDISNPPVYPCVLAGLMKVMKFYFAIPGEYQKANGFWGNSTSFLRYQPDFVIAVFNQLLMFVVIALVFLWARKLFDSTVAWSAAVLLLFTELLWRFSASGLSTILVMFIFMVLIWCLTLLEIEVREPRFGRHGAMILAGTAGVIVGVGALTQYSVGWLIIPTLFFLAICGGPRRAQFCLVALIYFAMVLTPWVIRNQNLSGAPFGTVTFSPLADTVLFPDDQLERSLDPNLRAVPRVLWMKLFANLHTIRKTLLGTGWVMGLFATGLLIGFRSDTLRRVRYFMLMCLGTLLIVQAVGRTQLSDASPEINSENLLIILLPVLLVYAVGFFCLLLDRLQLPVLELRVAAGLFGLAASLPMVLMLLRPEPTPLSYPPYNPPLIQQTAAWMKENELMMSDIPWAVAWYGNQQCAWVTLDSVPDADNPTDRENVLALADYLKPVSALYLTPLTIDSRVLSECIYSRENSWGKFVLRSLMLQQVPETFPLHQMPIGFLPEQLFLSDSKRWQEDFILPKQPSSLDPSVLPERPGSKSRDLFPRDLKRRTFR